MKERNVSLDIIRITALYCVISVHFFLNNGFYEQPILGWKMWFATVLRTGFMVCVPLFIVLTGYLMNKKTVSKQYYKGIRKTLSIYVLASVVCLAYRVFFKKEVITISNAFLSILNFSASQYAWYIEMYVGLYLLIPFLNIIWNNLKQEKQKRWLLMTFLFLTSFPSIINCYNWFDLSWWRHPATSQDMYKIVPSYWLGIYPITYYFLGCYLKEFKIKISPRCSIVLFIFSVALFGSYNYYRSYGSTFIWGMWQDWGVF